MLNAGADVDGVAFGLLVLGFGRVRAWPASADGVCQNRVRWRRLRDSAPANRQNRDRIPGAWQGCTASSAKKKAACKYRGNKVDCKSDFGKWNNERQCWVKRADDQPPKSDPVWKGHSDGAIYWCTPPFAAMPVETPYTFWSPVAPSVADPSDLAEEAIERMQLTAPTVGMTPLNPQAPMVVGVNAWLWLADAGPHAYGPITRSATAGSTTVTATAQVTGVTWDLGDGTTLTCAGPGTPWTRARGTGPSPTCGHTYEHPSLDEPDDTFDVTATTHWQVDWTGAGQSGEITFTLDGSREIEVTEVQVLQTG